MKKIGICTCYDSRNYGSMLQAYATKAIIDNLGLESEYIVYQKNNTYIQLLCQLPRLLNKDLLFDKFLILKKKIALICHPSFRNAEMVREKAFLKFKDNYYRDFSVPYCGYKELVNGARNYSTVLVGSDQLWTPGGLATNFYNLMFVPSDINKVSYATSFGVSSIPWYQINRTRRYLQRINCLSVREIKGVEIVKNIADRDAKIVVDPTLLLTKEDWAERIPREEIIHEPYIFCYFLGDNPEHRILAKELQRRTNCKIVCTPFLDSYVKNDEHFGDYKLFDVGPDRFLNLIRGASYVLTDSFHGSVFSIIHHKKFVVFNRYSENKNSRNSRIDSLCDILGLDDRRYSFSRDIYDQIVRSIDYTMVDNTIDKLRYDSIDFLSNAIGLGLKDDHCRR